MFFRNLTFFRFPAASITLEQLHRALLNTVMKPIGPLELSSRGFVPPLGAGQEFVHTVGQRSWITVGGEDRILPPSAVAKAFNERLAQAEAAEGWRLGGRARKRLKEDVLHELIPKALTRGYRLDGYLNLEAGLLVVDTASRKAAENFVSELRHALGTFPALPLNAGVSPRAVLTGWLADEKSLPPHFCLGEECTLKDSLDHGAVARFQREDLHGDEVRQHLAAGKQVTRLGLTAGPDSTVSFVLDEDLTVRKLRFLDAALEQLGDDGFDDAAAELSARFALMVSEVGLLFRVFEAAFDLTAAGEGAP